MMCWYFEKITTEEKEKMGKMIDIINEKNMLSVHVGEFRA